MLMNRYAHLNVRIFCQFHFCNEHHSDSNRLEVHSTVQTEASVLGSSHPSSDYNCFCFDYELSFVSSSFGWDFPSSCFYYLSLGPKYSNSTLLWTQTASILGKIQNNYTITHLNQLKINIAPPYHWWISKNRWCSSPKSNWQVCIMAVWSRVWMRQVTTFTASTNKTKKIILETNRIYLRAAAHRQIIRPFKIKNNQRKN